MTTLGSVVIDVFNIVVPALDETNLDEVRAEMERELYAVLPTPPRKVPEAS